MEKNETKDYKINKRNNIIFWSIIIAIMLFRIILVEVQPIKAHYLMTYDDILMLEQANNILHGNWLGEYNSLTLVKGCFTPAFIAFMNILHIPFLLGVQFFYCLACIFLVYILRNNIKSKTVLVLLFIILMFNPVMYSEDLLRPYRDNIYSSLIIYLMGFLISIFLNRKADIKKQVKYMIGLGVTTSFIYTCREENLWIMPIIIVASLITILFICIETKGINKIKKVLLYLIPISIFIIIMVIICSINYFHYGVFTLNQYWSKEFKSAYGALTRIAPERQVNRVPVTRDAMKKAYLNSETMQSLSDFFEGPKGDRWRQTGEGTYTEIGGGWFHWALIDAMEQAGYYKDAKTANETYMKIAEEINNACDNGSLTARAGKRASITPVITSKDIKNIVKGIDNMIKYQYKMEYLDIHVENTNFLYRIYLNDEIIEQRKELIENVTNNKCYDGNAYENNFDNIRIKTLDGILKIYKKINPILFYISIIAFIILLIFNIFNKNKTIENLIILLGLMAVYLSRILTVTFTYKTMYLEAMNYMYLSNIYPIQMIFGVLAIYYYLGYSN